MAKAKKTSIANQEITFVGTVTEIQKPGFRLQSSRSTLTKKVGEVKRDYDEILNQVSFILTDSDSKVKESGFQLEEIKVGLGFNAKGKIAFIAEAGVEASIEISFKRKAP